jgi:hypothetical protein
VTGLVKQDRTRAAVVLVTTWAWLGSVRASVRGAVSGHGAGRDDEQWELLARGVSGGETGGLRHFRGCGVVVGGACHGFRVSQRHACAATATGSVLVGHGCAPCRLVAPGVRHLRPSVYFPGHFSKSQCRAGVRAGCPTFGAVLVSVSKMVRKWEWWCHQCRVCLHPTRNPIHLPGSRLLGSGMPLICETEMCRSVHQCDACVVLLIHGVLMATWNGCGIPANDAGRRHAGLSGFGGGDDVSELSCHGARE